jgi:peptidyl-Asp metalloendopeptidase
LLVAYTPAVSTATADPDGLAQLAVDQMNRSFASSGIAANARLVHSMQLAYSEVAGFDAAVTHLITPGDGQLDEVQKLRDQMGADIVALLIDNDQYCGLAADILATEATAFTAVNYSCAVDNVSFSHELGHLLGARHNPEADPSTSPFAYGHGYQEPVGPWRTVMAYACAAMVCPRLEHWSNPSVSIGGRPTGTATTHDNARVLNETAGTIATFRTIAVGCKRQ